MCREKQVIYCQRDTYFDVDLRDMAKSDARLVVAIKKLRKFDRYGTVFISKGGYINGIFEKSSPALRAISMVEFIMLIGLFWKSK